MGLLLINRLGTIHPLCHTEILQIVPHTDASVVNSRIQTVQAIFIRLAQKPRETYSI